MPLYHWNRDRIESESRILVKQHTFTESFDAYIGNNFYLDLNTKVAALKVSPSVVALVSHSGDKLLFGCSGTIVECQQESSSSPCNSTILTSASLLRGRFPSRCDATLPPDIRVHVYLWDGKVYQGEISAWDMYFNLAIIKVSTNERLQTATIKHLDDSVPLNLSKVLGSTSTKKKKKRVLGSSSSELKGHEEVLPDSNSFKIRAGYKVIALGRHCVSHKIMAAPGAFRIGCCDLDCEPLYTASCKITVPGIGGPLINRHGEVIGINFFHESYTPFLPVNIVSKWLENIKKDGTACWPWVGVKAFSLGAASPCYVEQTTQKFPQFSKGILVKEVTSCSPAACAGIRPNDIIIQCCGKSIGSSSEFYGVIFDKIGETVEVSVRRPSDGTCFNLTLFAVSRWNRWPLPKGRKLK